MHPHSENSKKNICFKRYLLVVHIPTLFVLSLYSGLISANPRDPETFKQVVDTIEEGLYQADAEEWIRRIDRLHLEGGEGAGFDELIIRANQWEAEAANTRRALAEAVADRAFSLQELKTATTALELQTASRSYQLADYRLTRVYDARAMVDKLGRRTPFFNLGDARYLLPRGDLEAIDAILSQPLGTDKQIRIAQNIADDVVVETINLAELTARRKALAQRAAVMHAAMRSSGNPTARFYLRLLGQYSGWNRATGSGVGRLIIGRASPLIAASLRRLGMRLGPGALLTGPVGWALATVDLALFGVGEWIADEDKKVNREHQAYWNRNTPDLQRLTAMNAIDERELKREVSLQQALALAQTPEDCVKAYEEASQQAEQDYWEAQRAETELEPQLDPGGEKDDLFRPRRRRAETLRNLYDAAKTARIRAIKSSSYYWELREEACAKIASDESGGQQSNAFRDARNYLGVDVSHAHATELFGSSTCDQCFADLGELAEIRIQLGVARKQSWLIQQDLSVNQQWLEVFEMDPERLANNGDKYEALQAERSALTVSLDRSERFASDLERIIEQYGLKINNCSDAKCTYSDNDQSSYDGPACFDDDEETARQIILSNGVAALVPDSCVDKFNISDSAFSEATSEHGAALKGGELREVLVPLLQPFNDPYFNRRGSFKENLDDQWGLKRIFNAASNEKDLLADLKAPTTVAIIDSGIDGQHPELWSQMWINSGEIPGNNVDDDNNGFIDDVNGWNFVRGTNDTQDNNGHGTIVAGIIGATPENHLGISGVNPWVRLMPLKVANFIGKGSSVDIAAAIDYAARMGARVINISMGGEEFSATELEAVKSANEQGVLIAVAAGNKGVKADEYWPAGLEGVVTVAATEPDDSRAAYSNWGATVDIAAPGSSILSLRARDTDLMYFADASYQLGTNVIGPEMMLYHASGTSFAAPYVSGVASLLFSVNPDLSSSQVERMLKNSAKDISIPGIDQYTGYGLLDAGAAIKSDPEYFIETGITGVYVSSDKKSIKVIGTANSDQFKSAKLDLGKGDTPTDWKSVGKKIKKPVKDGELGKIKVKQLKGSKKWTIRITTEHKNGSQRTAWFLLSLG